MLSYRLLAFFSLLVTSIFFSFSQAGPHFPTTQTPPISGQDFGEVNGGLVSWGNKRFLAEGSSDEAPVSSSLVLAAERTRRKDPLDGFKKYTGGWNISERHYWASVGFTAAPFFVIAAAWFLVFGLTLSLICLCYCCFRREPYGYSQAAYALSLCLLILFTVAAIVGCVVLYTGQGRFHDSTRKTLDYVVNQANAVVQQLRDVSDYLAAAKQVGVLKVFLPSNVQTDIDDIESKINSSATTLASKTQDNSGDIKDLLDSMRLALIILSAVMLALTFLGFVFSIFGMQFLVYILVIIGWILVTGTFILCGVFLLLHNVTADTCFSMNQWVENPTSHTALDDILPCVDNATAQETLRRSKEVTSQLVDVINEAITNVSNINLAPAFAPLYYNQSGPLLPLLCNPFKPDLTDRACTAGEVDLDNATEVWRNYVCQVSASGICITTGRLTPTIYNQMISGVNVSFALYHYGPFLIDLQDCTFVRQTFTDVSSDHCPDLKQYSEWIYIGLVIVSAAVMLSLLFWVIYGRERRHRAYTKQHDAEFAGAFEREKNG
ncbi:uncharacterized protein LOC127792034 [Diospyros lotus]|uniref:uncharacterized protein LOC127792034 n=1 Tax=Diospyros lotus TaxID=55363 RepID=UPI002254C53C|nr:uncharacterized protein LOC127792034 [Diospyros lotus]